jgi:hypothetical protein
MTLSISIPKDSLWLIDALKVHASRKDEPGRSVSGVVTEILKSALSVGSSSALG